MKERLRTSPLPSTPPLVGSRYQQVARALLGDIRSSRYKVGALLPSEAALQQRFGVSRHTIRQALRELKGMGVVSSHPGVGTTVKGTATPSKYVHTSSSFDDLLRFSTQTRLHVLAVDSVVVDAQLAAVLRCTEGQERVRIDVERRDRAGTTLGVVTIYLWPEFGSIVDSVEGSDKPVFALLEERFDLRIVEIQQEISSVQLDASVRKIFRDSQEHGLQIVRHYLDASDRVVETSISNYSGSTFVFRSTMRVGAGG